MKCEHKAFSQLASIRNRDYILTIVDAATSFQSVGAGLALTASSLSVLQELGVYEDVLKVGRQAMNVVLFSDSKVKVMRVLFRTYF